MYIYVLCLLTKILVTAEVITLIDKQDVICVLTNESTRLAVYVTPDLTPEQVPANTELKWLDDDWTVTNSSDMYGPIIDKRWQNLQQYNASHVIRLNDKPASISVCYKHTPRFTLYSVDYDEQNFTLTDPSSRSSSSSCKWFHYTIQKKNNTLILSNNKIVERYRANFPINTIFFNASLKLHKYNFTFSQNVTTNSERTISVELSKNLCLSMFVSVDLNCWLNITLSVANQTRTERVQGFNQKNMLKTWKRIKIPVDFSGSGTLSFFRGHTNPQTKNGYWAIDYITFCNEDVEIYRIALPSPLVEPIRCELLDQEFTTLRSETYCRKLGYLGANCTVSCKEVLGMSYPLCESHKVCNQHHCRCSWGYHGERCSQVCGKSYWGMDCTSKCSNNCEDCDAKRGCIKCHKRYFGDDCYKLFPVLKHIPVLKLLTQNSAIITLEDLSYGEGESQPEFYQIQLKTVHDKEFKNYGLPETYDLKSKHFLIGNLSRDASEYIIRVVLIVEGKYYDEGVPELSTHKKILRVNSVSDSHISLELVNILEVNSWTVKYSCSEEFCLLNGVWTNLTIHKNSFEIDNLKNYSICTIKLFNSSGNVKDVVHVPMQPYKAINENFSLQLCNSTNSSKTPLVYYNKTISEPPKLNLSITTSSDIKMEIHQVFIRNLSDPICIEIVEDNFRAIAYIFRREECHPNCTYNISAENSKSYTVTKSTIKANDSTLENVLKTTFKSQELQNSNISYYLELKISWSQLSNNNITKMSVYTELYDGDKFIGNYPSEKKQKIIVQRCVQYKLHIYSSIQNISKTSVILPLNSQMSTKPPIEICDDNCYFLIPKPETRGNSTYYAALLHNNYHTNEEITMALYKLVNKEKHEKELNWRVFTVQDDNGYVRLELGGVDQAVSLYKRSNVSFYFIEVTSSGHFIYKLNSCHQDVDHSRSSSGTVTVLTVTLLICLLLLITAFCLYRFIYKRFIFKSRSDEEAAGLILLSTREEKYGDIGIGSLEKYIKRELNKGIVTQFQSLPETTKSTDIAMRRKNKNKNRDHRHVPYDYNRVVLQKMEGVGNENYINASYINSFVRPKTYIATQGPKLSTVADFWRMVWQQEAETIIMASNFVENNIRKCVEYLPPTGNNWDYGALAVRVIHEETHEYYDKRILEMFYIRYSRRIKHYHLKWDSECLNTFYPNRVVPIVKVIRKVRDGANSPIVIHCCSGVNRTATLILCDLALQAAKINNSVNFYALLKNMREQRSKMVTSEEQYVLAHLVVLESLLEGSNPFRNVNAENLDLLLVKEQLSYLEKVCWHDNVVKTWMPAQDHNKTFFRIVEGYRKETHFVTHPGQYSVGQLWDIIIRERLKCIVVLNRPNESKPFLDLWPFISEKGGVTTIVTKSSLINENHYTNVELHLRCEENKMKVIYEEKITLVQLCDWDSKEAIPSSVEGMLHVINRIHKIHNRNGTPVLVTDSVGGGSLFAILSYAVEKYRNEDELDVLNAIRTVRRSDSKCINTFKQMQFIYESMWEFLENFAEYTHVE